MSKLLEQRLAVLEQHPGLLSDCLRGLEKEGLRTTPDGQLAQTAHPSRLGSALTHPYITTDYAESLLELITSTHRSVGDLMQAIDWVHRLTVDGLDDELMWGHSMPPQLPPEKDIQIGWYGPSNAGMLKHVYRRGLEHRYGKAMQCIAGIHYNFSFPDRFWTLLPLEGDTPQDRQSAGYVSLIRNFVRHSWLLMYLFGASPAFNRAFLPNPPDDIQVLDSDTLYLPWATSLRMSDLGYQSNAQATLTPCYNDLPTFLQRLYDAVSTPWPDYEAIGTHRDGEWIQLNTNLLQIENEYYSSIRPKRTTTQMQRPITALFEDGIQYVEVRCLDVNPLDPHGISAQTSRFLDTFLLFCALDESPFFGDRGFCKESAKNFGIVVREGRKPGLSLSYGGDPIALKDWAEQVFDRLDACAQLLADHTGDPLYTDAINQERAKVRDASLTPSARILTDLQEGSKSFQSFALETSMAHTEGFRRAGLNEAERSEGKTLRDVSVQAQAALEAEQGVSFDEFVAQFHQALKPPTSGY